MTGNYLIFGRKNATERLLQAEGKDRRARRALEAFCLYTGIKKADYIEIYDVSMLAGTDVVCGCVGITDGAFCKDRYRKFKIGKYEGRDDTALWRKLCTAGFADISKKMKSSCRCRI